VLSGNASSINGVPLSSCGPDTLRGIGDVNISVDDEATGLVSSHCFGIAVGLELGIGRRRRRRRRKRRTSRIRRMRDAAPMAMPTMVPVLRFLDEEVDKEEVEAREGMVTMLEAGRGSGHAACARVKFARS